MDAPTTASIIERAKQELQQMIDLNPEVMLLVDGEGRIVRANRALLHMLGTTAYQDVLGKPFGEVFAGGEAVVGPTTGLRETATQEVEVELPDEQKKVFQFTTVAATQLANLSVVVIRDLSEEKEAAASLELRHRREAVNALTASLAHTINQSLTVIIVRAQLMHLMVERGLLGTGDAKAHLDDIVNHAGQIAGVLTQASGPPKFSVPPPGGDVAILDGGPGGAGVSVPAEPARTALWLESSYSAVIDLLLKALDAHHNGSTWHARRTAACAGVIARRMGLGDDEVRRVESGAALHDIGKISIADATLQKSVLSGPEQESLRAHAEIGFQILGNLPFARAEAAVARSHHERYDGGGYPQKLAGRDIPLHARIVAVANAFDNLRYGPSLQRRLRPEQVSAEIIGGAGVQFDPDVIAAFRASCHDIQALFRTGGTGAE